MRLLLIQVARQLGLDLLDAGQAGIERLWQGADELVFGHANGLVDPGEGLFGDEPVPGSAEQQANGWLVIVGLDLCVDRA